MFLLPLPPLHPTPAAFRSRIAELPSGEPTHHGGRLGYRSLLDGSVGFRPGGVGVGGEIRVGSNSDRVDFNGGEEVLLVARHLHVGGNAFMTGKKIHSNRSKLATLVAVAVGHWLYEKAIDLLLSHTLGIYLP
ncbi:hypothetical protein V6N11_052328 [Hibiscus sabdariffa]|uniref:Uncharacterized protein n=1 Tax=Hibiscus sabdariffa TaxID=183260 RepID=A0ABR2U9T4_9ROSI